MFLVPCNSGMGNGRREALGHAHALASMHDDRREDVGCDGGGKEEVGRALPSPSVISRWHLSQPEIAAAVLEVEEEKEEEGRLLFCLPHRISPLPPFSLLLEHTTHLTFLPLPAVDDGAE